MNIFKECLFWWLGPNDTKHRQTFCAINDAASISRRCEAFRVVNAGHIIVVYKMCDQFSKSYLDYQTTAL